MNSQTNSMSNIRTLTQLAILSAIIAVLAFTPLGSIPLGGPIVATIVQFPVVVGAILMGPKAGGFLGGVFGLCSMLWFTIYGTPTAFVFSPFYSSQIANGTMQTILYALGAIVTCFLPRILIGIVSAYVYRAIARKDKHQFFACGVAGVAGAMTNTILVMGCILLFFMQPYADVNGVLPSALWGIIGTTIAVNGVLEAIVTGVLVVAIAKPLLLITKKRKA